MLDDLVFDYVCDPKEQAIVTPEAATTWSELRNQATRFLACERMVARRRVGIRFRPAASSYAALAALKRLSSDVFLFDSRTSLEATLELANRLKLGIVLDCQHGNGPQRFEGTDLHGEASWSGTSTVTILTSGSTGEPKAARHTWEGLSRPVRKGSANKAPRWMLTYRPNLYAGLQVMLQCFADHGTLVIPEPDMEPGSVAQFMSDKGVQYVSATPSYWRRLLMFADPVTLAKNSLIQITLGGEIVDQVTLDKLKHHFPKTRLVHIYATTELGRCFSVTDGLAGFPATYLESAMSDGCELKVQGGELFVRSPNSMRMYDPLSSEASQDSGWFATSDLVEIRDRRVYFVGRKSDMINVAGSKVYPIEVERILRTIPGILDVRVYGKKSSIAGELVACDIIMEANQDRSQLKEAINRHCGEKLTSYQRPRIINFVERIELSVAGKMLRTQVQ